MLVYILSNVVHLHMSKLAHSNAVCNAVMLDNALLYIVQEKGYHDTLKDSPQPHCSAAIY